MDLTISHIRFLLGFSSCVDSVVRLVVVFVHDESDPIIKLVVFHGLVGVRLGDLLWV